MAVGPVITLIDVMQGYPGAPPGFPLVGVVVDPPEATCRAFLLPGWVEQPCLKLGGVVPLGMLYAHGVTFPGEVSALLFEEPAS